MIGLFLMDYLSDIVQTVSLYKNCHNDFCGISLLVIASSYFTSAICIKFGENLEWPKALSYPVMIGYAKFKIALLLILVNLKGCVMK